MEQKHIGGGGDRQPGGPTAAHRSATAPVGAGSRPGATLGADADGRARGRGAPRAGGALVGTFLIDGHVHWYDAFGPGLLDDAARNLAAAAHDLDIVPVAGALLFTEGAHEHAFELLRTGRRVPSGWTVGPTAEDRALLATRPGDLPLILIAGHQITTAEGLEILALGTLAPIASGLPLSASVVGILEVGGLPVLPWGFGKWWGARGRALARFLETTAVSPFFLGDTANRPAGLPPPALFGPARRRGIPILPGSDPLPLPAGATAVGRYGFVLEGRVERDRPAVGLLALIQALERQPPTFGRLAGPGTFVARQIAMQRRKRRLPGATRQALVHDTEAPDVETASAAYARRFAGPVGAWFLEVQCRLVLSLLPAAAGRPLQILEVGGGHGQLTEALLAAGHEVVVQGSAPMGGTRARTLRDRYPTRLHLVTAPLWALPFPDRVFDAAIGVRLLAHVARYESLLGEMARVSRGGVIVDFPPKVSANLLEPLLFQIKRRIERDTRPFFVYRAGALMRPLAAAGYGRFRLEKQFFWPMVVHRKTGRRRLCEALERPPRALGLTRLLGGPALLAAERIEEPPR